MACYVARDMGEQTDTCENPLDKSSDGPGVFEKVCCSRYKLVRTSLFHTNTSMVLNGASTHVHCITYSAYLFVDILRTELVFAPITYRSAVAVMRGSATG